MNIQMQNITESIGAMLLHSLWQGFILAIILFIILKIFNDKSPQFKYHLACASLLGLVVWMLSTFVIKISELQALDTSAINPDKGEFNPLQNFIPHVLEAEQGIEIYFNSFVNHYADELVAVWLIGVVLFGLKWMGAFYFTQMIKRKYIKPISIQWQNKVKQLSYDLGIDKTIKIMESTKVDVPMVIGYLKPVILIPTSAITGFSPAQLESVIIHELAHIKKNDFLVNLILSALEVILFYHPAYWYISKIINQERENRCDDLAVAHLGNPRLYAETLFNMEKIRQQKSLGMALQGNKNQLLDRIKRICIHPNQSYKGGINKSGAAFGLLLIIAIISVFQVPMDAKENILIPLKEEIKEALNIIEEENTEKEIKKKDETFTIPQEYLEAYNYSDINHPKEDIVRNENPREKQYINQVPRASLSEIKSKEISLLEPLTPNIILEHKTVQDSFPSKSAYKTVISKLDHDGNTVLEFYNHEGRMYREVFIEKNKAKFKLNGRKLPLGNHTYYLEKGDSFSITGTMQIFDKEESVDINSDELFYDNSSESNLFNYDDYKSLSIKENDKGDITIIRKDNDGNIIEERTFNKNNSKEELKLYEKYMDEQEKRIKSNMTKVETTEVEIMANHDKAMKEHEKAMQRHEKEMEKHKKNLEKLEEKLKEMDERKKEIFYENLVNELKSDNIIKKKNIKKLKFHLKSDELKVNGKVQPEHLLQKYRSLYEDYMGKKMNSDSTFKWHKF